jgi:hypothetical protein
VKSTAEVYHQTRFTSSPGLERGLSAQFVAMRCSALTSAEDRDFVWSIQASSMEPGRLKRLAVTLITRFPERVATPAMRRFGFKKAGQVYSREQVKAVRAEIPCGEDEYPLYGEDEYHADFYCDSSDSLAAIEQRVMRRALDNGEVQARRDAAKLARDSKPRSYPTQVFVERCRTAAERALETTLADMALDPKLNLATFGPWWWWDLVSSVREFQAEQIAQRRAAQVVTELGRELSDTLAFALETRAFVLATGPQRSGITHAARAFCELHPGRARLVATPAPGSDMNFYQAIADGVGIHYGGDVSPHDLRARIEDVLQGGDLLLIVDNAWCVFPRTCHRHAAPSRLHWLMQLAERGVPIALVSDPRFLSIQRAFAAKTEWDSECFTRRVHRRVNLPERLSEKDLASVAKALLPEGSAACVEGIASYAHFTKKGIVAIQRAVMAARFIAQRDGRAEATDDDVRAAFKTMVKPSDAALVADAAPNGRRLPRTIAAPIPFTVSRADEQPPPASALAARSTQPAPDPDVDAGNRLAKRGNALAETTTQL